MTLATVANHLWQSTLFALVAALLTAALRSNRAGVRYYLWLAASVKFLIPFAVLETLGSRIPWKNAAAAPAVTFAIAHVSQPFSAGSTPTEVPAVSSAGVWLPLVLAVTWLAGVLWVAFGWHRWRHTHTSCRSGGAGSGVTRH